MLTFCYARKQALLVKNINVKLRKSARAQVVWIFHALLSGTTYLEGEARHQQDTLEDIKVWGGGGINTLPGGEICVPGQLIKRGSREIHLTRGEVDYLEEISSRPGSISAGLGFLGGNPAPGEIPSDGCAGRGENCAHGSNWPRRRRAVYRVMNVSPSPNARLIFLLPPSPHLIVHRGNFGSQLICFFPAPATELMIHASSVNQLFFLLYSLQELLVLLLGCHLWLVTSIFISQQKSKKKWGFLRWYVIHIVASNLYRE